MESLECLEQYEKILCADPEIKKAYADTLGWIRKSKAAWIEKKINVGVIGVTSSGKSTLINAILGMDILSSAVVPSSGLPVKCTYGEERKAIISFLDGSQKELTGRDFSLQNIKKYSDERDNKENTKGVMEIELQTPDFELGEDVFLIDSPGLDAFGLEAHEKITLETIVPSLDICMYVTTTRTNSDDNTLLVLNTIAGDERPIIVVQNKLDAVNESLDGKKSKEEVAQEHFYRVKRIIDQSSIQEKDSVEIIQVSSIYAKEWRVAKAENRCPQIDLSKYEESNFPLLLEKTKACIDFYRPYIESSRMENLYGYIQGLCTEISDRINTIDNLGPTKKNFDYAKKMEEIDEFIESNNKRAIDIANSITEKFDDFSIQMMKKSNEDNIDTYASDANKLINKWGDELYDFIKNVNSKILKYGTYIHFSGRDLLKMPQVRDFQKVEVTVYEEESLVRKKEAGIGGFFKRFAGLFGKDKDKGYEYVTETVVVKDVITTRDNINRLLFQEKIRYKKILSAWGYDCSLICKSIWETLNEEYDGFLRRQEAQIEEKRLRKYYDDLQKLEERVKNGILEKEKWIAGKYPQKKKSTKKLSDGEISESIFKLSVNSRKLQNIEIMKELVKQEGLEDYVPILLGWDENCSNDFSWNAGISDLRVIHLSKEEAPKEKDGVDTCFFVLVNASQIGSEKNKVKNLKLAEIVEPADFVVWVVQDFDELINSYGVEEALRNMLWLREFSEIESKSVIWISHSNPIYNLSFLEHQYSPKKTSLEQTNYIDFIRKNYSVYCDEMSIGIIAREILKVRV